MSRRGEQFRCVWPWLVVGLVLAAGSGCTEGSSLTDTDIGGEGGTTGDGGPSFGGGGSAGTGGAAGSEAGDGGEGGEGGIPSIDAFFLEVELFADPERAPFDPGQPVPPESANQYAALAADCYRQACTDPSCTLLAACCVDSTLCCSRELNPPLPTVIDFAACDGLSVTACAEEAGSSGSAFGPQEPTITARGLIPGGDLSADGGAVVGEAVDLATRTLELNVEFGRPIGCGPSCLESVGVVLTESPPSAFVDAELGLLLSGARDEVNLMIGGNVAESFAAQSDRARWELSASPSGTVIVRRDGVELTERTFDPVGLRSARLVLFGRNLSETARSATVALLESTVSLCDVPRAWELRAPVTISDGGQELPAERFGRQPSIETDGLQTRIAYAIEGEIAWGIRLDGVAEEFDLFDLGQALVPTEAHESGGIQDPELVWDGAQWHLFYTAEDDAGLRTVGHALAGPSDSDFVADAVPTLVDAEVNLEAPTVHFREGLWILVVRATQLADGVSELRAYYSPDLSGGWIRVGGSQLESLTRVTDPTEEIAEPSLVVHNSAYQLYYARRVGTRWLVELLSSDEMLVWRSLGQVLAEGQVSFDSLGARAPDALSEGARIDLAYEGQDGISFRLGLASRPAPADSAPDPF